MKKIIFLLTLIMLIFQQSNALEKSPAKKENIPQGEKRLNVSWSIEDAATQTKINSVQLSPDGKYVLVENTPPYLDSTKNQPSEISLINNETKEVVWKTPSEWLCLNPHWSPDGKNISFLRMEAEGKYTLYLTPIDKYEPIEVAQGTWDVSDYSWSPDGKSIAFNPFQRWSRTTTTK